MKKLVVSSLLLLISGIIIWVFWNQELVYNLPTPQPKNYTAMLSGQSISLPLSIKKDKKPVFLHFYNPDCPCSRFNMKHFKELQREYKNRANFIIVAQTKNPAYTPAEIQNKFDLQIPVIIDGDKNIAASCGVYSTPQAVILDTENKLYYRGNYNRARYCIDKKTNFAQIALDSLLAHNKSPLLHPIATRSYGCKLPNYK